MTHSTAPQSRARTAALLADLENERDRRALGIWLRHWWAEVEYDLEGCLDTLTPDVAYRWHGTEQVGDGLDAGSHDFARTMYGGMFEAGLMPGGPFDRERWAFGDWGLTLEAVFTSVMPGSLLKGASAQADPSGLYLVQWPMVVVHAIDPRQPLMASEIMYAGAPSHIEPADRRTIARLLGCDAPALSESA